MDPRNATLARQVVDYSLGIAKGESLLIEAKGGASRGLVREIAAVAAARGAFVHVNLLDDSILRRILLESNEEQIAALATHDLARMKEMQCYVVIRGADNLAELGDVPSKKLELYQSLVHKPVHTETRVPNTRWVVLRYPNEALAQTAGRSVDGFADFYYDACTIDYERMSRAMDPLAELMARTDRVEIRGVDTELGFSIAGIPNVKCDGHVNVPDGEVFTSPVRDSVDGHIRYNCASLYQGTVFPSVRLTFEKGRVVDARTDGDQERLNAILDTDEGARYIGEFAVGFHPLITVPDARHALRREDRRFHPHGARPGVRDGRQREPLGDPLGPRPLPAARGGRRRAALRRSRRSSKRALRRARARGARLRGAAGDSMLLTKALDRLRQNGVIVVEGDGFALAGRGPQLSRNERELLASMEARLRKAERNPRRQRILCAQPPRTRRRSTSCWTWRRRTARSCVRPKASIFTPRRWRRLGARSNNQCPPRA